MNYGMCPNCFNKLTEESAIQTGLSEIFKGNNSYLLCKNCQQVLLYNMNRDMIFDLDEYKEDKDVIAEINKLLSEIDNHYEVQSNANCTGDCNSCPGCAVTEQAYQRRTSRKSEPTRVSQPDSPTEPVKQIEEVAPTDIISSTLSNSLIAVNKKDPSVKIIIADSSDLDDIDIDEWVFFSMSPVTIEVKKSYNIIRH